MNLFRFDYLVQFFTLLAPIFIPLFLVFLSLMQTNFKGLIFLAGLVSTVGLGAAIKAMTKARVNLSDHYSPACYVMDIGSVKIDGLRTLPCIQSVIIAFSIFYLIYPLFIQSKVGHLTMIIFLFLYMILNGISRMHLKCVRFIDVIAGWIFGAIMGVLYAVLIDMIDGSALYFSADDSEYKDGKCFRYSNTRMKCKLVPKVSQDPHKHTGGDPAHSHLH